MIRLGITGGIGAGKSVICKILEVLGIPVFYADKVGRELLTEPNIIARVVEIFGEHVIGQNDTIDRAALASLVFSSDKELDKLTDIIHPEVRKRFGTWCELHEKYSVVGQEAAVMIESGGFRTMDHLLVVSAPQQLRIDRVVARDGVTPEQVRSRMANQLSESERCAYADTVVLNDEKHLVVPQLLKLVEELSSGSGPL